MAEMPPLASIYDFEGRLNGNLAAADVTRVETLLADASALVRGETKPVTWTTTDPVTGDVSLDDVPQDVIRVVCMVAQRAFRNPSGYVSESVGEWSGTRPQSDPVSEVLFLTRGERRSVKRAAELTSVGSVVLESPFGPGIETTYLAVDPPGEPIPWSDQ